MKQSILVSSKLDTKIFELLMTRARFPVRNGSATPMLSRRVETISFWFGEISVEPTSRWLSNGYGSSLWATPSRFHRCPCECSWRLAVGWYAEKSRRTISRTLPLASQRCAGGRTRWMRWRRENKFPTDEVLLILAASWWSFVFRPQPATLPYTCIVDTAKYWWRQSIIRFTRNMYTSQLMNIYKQTEQSHWFIQAASRAMP